MTPVVIIKESAKAGVRLTLSPDGILKAADKRQVVVCWLPLIREQKSQILTMLRQLFSGSQANITDIDDPAWRIECPKCNPLQMTYSSASIPGEGLSGEPAAVALKSLNASGDQLGEPFSDEDKAAILNWLRHIGETDEEGIAELLAKCEADIAYRKYYVGRAEQALLSGALSKKEEKR